ncbi:hypothetical protein ROD_07371 [Citrobacter rodentium ICC168]|uniref:Uncharacterized protein n=1 Tax=Citrobacter rodentium (strain ICC168) TaxID=637910 RepID=D2TPE5_CITRI|nr:hypothetical protein ROD_07371 [Citrobacter rodentium ICC168]
MLNKIADWAEKVTTNTRGLPDGGVNALSGLQSASNPGLISEAPSGTNSAHSKKAPLGRLFTLVGRAG